MLHSMLNGLSAFNRQWGSPLGVAGQGPASPALAPRAADSKAQPGDILAEVRQLQERSVAISSSYRLEIRSPDGRSAKLSFDYAAFSFEQTYQRQTLVGAGRAEQGSQLSAAREALAQHNQAAFLGVEASSMSLSVEGDMNLIREHFAAAPTAQRIFDFASGLGGGMAADDQRFPSFAAAISRGIASGFAQAQQALGGLLAPVSQDTRTLLDAMLARFRESGERQQASDFLSLIERPKDQ